MKRKTALITGASRGIGKAIARTFAEEGYDLFLTCSQRIDLLSSLKDELEHTYHISCRVFCSDAGDPMQTDELFRSIQKDTDTLDVLVNNAGISYVGLLTDMTVEEWNRILQVNLSSVFYTSKLAIPMMLANHSGKIIQISSVWGCVGASCEVAYSAAKGAVNAFTMALAKELAPSNIQVNAIACGTIDTEMNHFLSDEDRKDLEEEIPAGRFADPSEAADMCRMLLHAPDYLTGQIIRLDGGWI